jgi:hypothetical protein
MRLSIKPRIGNFRPFLAAQTRENSAAGETLMGFTTYGENEAGEATYETSYIGLSARSDHGSNLIAKASGSEITERLISEAGADELFVGDEKQNERPAEEEDTATEATAA